MIKAEELMIGNWVLDGTKYAQVTSITCDGIIETTVNKKSNIELLEPIPITPEILEKNGFEEEVREGDPTFPYSAFILDGDDYRIEITWYDSHDRYEPNTGQFLGGVPEVWAIEVNSKRSNVDIERNKMYVHELQHALRLCGITKKIEL